MKRETDDEFIRRRISEEVEKYRKRGYVTLAQEVLVREFKAFAKRHPDYKDYESELIVWGNKVAPVEGCTPREYLHALYVLAKADVQ